MSYLLRYHCLQCHHEWRVSDTYPRPGGQLCAECGALTAPYQVIEVIEQDPLRAP